MTKRFFCILFFLLTITKTGFSHNKLVFGQLSDTTKKGFKQVAAKFQTGSVEYQPVVNALKNSGVDFSNMSIEDAVMYLFALIADDAREDLKDMLEEMRKTNQQKEDARKFIETMKKARDSLLNLARNQYKGRYDSLAIQKDLNEKTIKLQQYSNQEKEAIAAANKAAEGKAAAEKHLQSVEAAIKKLQQAVSPKKAQ